MTLEPKILDRRLVVVGAVLVQLALGAVYAWSVFTPALNEAGWSKLETQITFSVALAALAVTMVFAGRLLVTWGPRTLVRRGGWLLATGYVLAGLTGGASFPLTTVFLGLVSGAGIGLAYVVPIAVGMRWFPDRRGMISGIAVAGFGFGALGWIKLAGEWGGLLETYGLSGTFIIFGVAFAVLVTLGSTWMLMPPGGWRPAGWTPPATTAAGNRREYTSAEMLRTVQFGLIFLTFVASGAAGLMSIGLMKLYPMEALQASGLSKVEASAIAGTAMAVFFSIANGVGRIAWGTLSDRLGPRRSVLMLTASQGVILLLFTGMAGQEYLLYLGATLIGFNFGGNFALFPSLTAETFGANAVGQNYPFVFLAYGVGGIAGPILGGMLGDMGNFPLAFTICGIACLIGAGLMALVRPLPAGPLESR